MVEHQPSKLDTWVRFPSPAFFLIGERKKQSRWRDSLTALFFIIFFHSFSFLTFRFYVILVLVHFRNGVPLWRKRLIFIHFPKAKVQYVWDYYKWPIAAAIAALCFVIYLIYHYATYRDPLLNVIMMNCNDSITADSKGFDEFLEACGYDPKEDSVSLTSSLQFSDGEYSTSYNDTQVLTLMLAAGGQDLFFGTGSEYLDYANQGALMDLSTVLSDELLDRYQDHLIYTTEDGAVASYPCNAIELTDNAWLHKYNYYDSCYFRHSLSESELRRRLLTVCGLSSEL